MPSSKRSSVLTGCTARDLGQLGEMAVWVLDFDDNGMISLGLDIRNSMWTDSCDEIYTRWTRWLSDLGAPDLKASAFSAFLDSTRECLEPVPDSMRWRWAR